MRCPTSVNINKMLCHQHHISELGSCVKVKVAILGSTSLISLMVSVDIKQD